MAVITGNRVRSDIVAVETITWGALVTGDTGTPFAVGDLTDLTVQATGTVTDLDIEGSNDGTNWFIVKDPANADVTFVAAGLKKIDTNPAFIRPSAVAGAAIIVVIHASARG